MTGHQKGDRHLQCAVVCGQEVVAEVAAKNGRPAPRQTRHQSSPSVKYQKYLRDECTFKPYIKSILKQQFNFSTLITIHLVKSNHWIFLDYWMLLILSDVLSDY